MECKADHAVELPQNAGLKKPQAAPEAEICAAARGRAAERKAGSVLKRSPAQAQPAEKSSDSSPLSGVSASSCKPDSPLSCRASSSSPKDQGLPSGADADAPCPAAKRHCPDGPKAALLASGQQAKKKWSAADSKKLAPSNAMQEGVVDPAGGADDNGLDPADLVSWPDMPLDFVLETLGAGEIEDLSGQQSAAAARLGLRKRAAEKETRGAAAKEGSQDSQSESAREGPEASEPQGTEGTSSSGAKGGKASPPGKRKVKVDWTPDLHRKFVQAVEQLGVEKAIPSRILELMGVKCLTRHNIASHLQKYRSHRRHLAAREAEAANWQQQRKAADAPLWPVNKPGSGNFSGWGPFGAPAAPAVPGGAPMGYAAGLPAAGPVPGRPVMGLPPPGVVHGMPHMGPPVPGAPAGAVSLGQPQPNGMGAPPLPAIGMPMQVWGHPTHPVDHAHAHMWQRPGAVYPMPPPAWFGPDGSVWHYPTPFQQAPAVDMWGNPTAPAPGFPGGGMVAGTPCFPQQMQMHPGPPQRMASGMSSSGPGSGPGLSPGLFSPAMGAPTGMGPEPETPHTPAVSGMSSETGAVDGGFQGQGEGEEEEEEEEEEEMRGMKAALESVTSVDDSFIEDALHESLFNMPEEFSLDFGACTSDLQASSALDAAISEALANPSTPLPLGLKPPSVDGVLEELNRQGITMLPPLKGCGAHLGVGALALDIKAELLGDDMLSEVDNHPLSLCGDMHGESDDALNALLDP